MVAQGPQSQEVLTATQYLIGPRLLLNARRKLGTLSVSYRRAKKKKRTNGPKKRKCAEAQATLERKRVALFAAQLDESNPVLTAVTRSQQLWNIVY